MAVKYRVRLKDRVLGPFSEAEISELYLKEHISGKEEYQVFPIGEWKKFQTNNSFVELFKDLEVKKIQQKKINEALEKAKKNKKEDSTQSKIKNFREFVFGKDVKIEVDYNDLEKKYREEHGIEDDEFEKTRTFRKRPKQNKNVDKTVVIASRIQKPIVSQDNLGKTGTVEETTAVEEPKGPSVKELSNEATEFIPLAWMMPTINAELKNAEIELEQKLKLEEANERRKQRQLEEEEARKRRGLADDEELIEVNGEVQVVKKEKKKKGMSIIVAITFLALFYVLLDSDKKPEATGPSYVIIRFPKINEFVDEKGSEEALAKARALYGENTYIKRLQAMNFYLISLEKKFHNNDALGEFLLNGAELLENAKDKIYTQNEIYKLILVSENKMLLDLNAVAGAALFFDKIGKYQTGINIVKNYMRAKGPVSAKLLAYYLDLLIHDGDLVTAKTVFDKIMSTPKKSFEVYYQLSKYFDIDENIVSGKNIIEEGLKVYPNNVLLLSKYAEYLFKEQSYNKYAEVLKKINQLEVERSPVFLAKYFELAGQLAAIKKNNKEASILFNRSLALKESDELRTRLAELDLSGDQRTKNLILESKVLNLIKKAKAEMKNGNYEVAISFAVEAVDAKPDSIPAVLLLSDLQIKKGMFEPAINSLIKIIGLNPHNFQLKVYLAKAFLRAFKFQDVESILIDLSQTKFATTAQYASLKGDFFFEKGEWPQALKWYGESLNRNPLNDRDMFQLAKIFIRTKKFDLAKQRISKALTLDPRNPDYIAANAEIIFERDNSSTALGYLRDAMTEIGENSRLLTAITVMYYKSGQIKDFQNSYRRVVSLPHKDESFYEFLMEAAKLEEKSDDYVTNAKELLKINPGNLKVRMDLAETFLELKKYEDAISELSFVKEKLASYPKVHYHLARVYLAMGDVDKAKEMANKELEMNSNLDSAYFIVGEISRFEKNYRDAVQKYEKAISLNPHHSEAIMAMAWIRLNQNYASEALELYNRALREDRNNPEIYKQMGFAYKAAGQRALAKEKFEEYLKINPGAKDKPQIDLHIKALE